VVVINAEKVVPPQEGDHEAILTIGWRSGEKRRSLSNSHRSPSPHQQPCRAWAQNRLAVADGLKLKGIEVLSIRMRHRQPQPLAVGKVILSPAIVTINFLGMSDIKIPKKTPQHLGTGRRKSGLRACDWPLGTGQDLVNGRPLKPFFPSISALPAISR